MKDITFIIHTFKRPKCFSNLLKGIKKYYPENKVIVYDDSNHDRGLSWGRNHLVSQVKTPYYLLLDDDFEFTAETKIELLKKEGYDIVGGAIRQDGNIRHYEGRYELKDGHLKYIPSVKEPLDFVFNFFLAKREVTGWDVRLKLAEHTAFFFTNKGKWKIGYEPRCIITHKPVATPDYKKCRNRAWEYFNDYMVWNNIKTVTNFEEGTHKLGDYKKYIKEYEDTIS